MKVNSLGQLNQMVIPTSKRINQAKIVGYCVISIFASLLIIPTLSQLNLNYAGNGDYKSHTCTVAQLSAPYTCAKNIADGGCGGCGCSVNYNFTSNATLNLQNELNFNTTMTGIVVATLDYKNGTLYYKRDYNHYLYPIYGGNYRLSFTAMTRKTGNLADYSFMVLIRSKDWTSFIYFNKTYVFSDYGTMNITENITLPGPYQYTQAFLHFTYAGTNASPYTSQAGAGITNVVFEKLACGTNQTLTLLTSGVNACILNKTLLNFNTCTKFNYYHYNNTYPAVYIEKGFTCEACTSPYKNVGFFDTSYPTYENLHYMFKFGCTILEIPYVTRYRLLTLKDPNGMFYYGSNACSNGFGNQIKLAVPGIGYKGYDDFWFACGQTNTSMTHYQVANGTYLPAKCTTANYYPVIMNSTSRVCKAVSVTISSCAVYLADNSCYTCLNDMTSIMLNNSGTVSNVCASNFTKVQNCYSYALVSTSYICSSCNTNYTVTTINSLKVCVRTNWADANCGTYILNANNQYECSVCATGSVFTSVFTSSGVIQKCLLTASQIIRDCSVYESIPGGFQCYTCATSTNIGRYSFIYNLLQAFRCINTLNEYLPYCSTYSMANSVYNCTTCSSGYQFINVTIATVPTLKCLNTLTEVVSGCANYQIDASSNYVCTTCSSGFTLISISGVSKCLPNNVIDSQCTTYILNGSNYQCNQCNLLYTISSVYTTSGTFKYCLLTSIQIRDCSIYQSISSGGYQCYTCSSATNIAKYSYLLNGVQAYRCLNTVSQHVDYCTTYQLTSQVYSCSACDSDHELKLIPIDAVNQPRCLSKLTQIISNCQSYVTDVTNGYVCSSCGNDFTVKTVSGTNKCLPNNVIDSQCINYILNGSNYECSQCNSLYTVSSVYTTSGTFKYCLLTGIQIRDCSIYETTPGGYQCRNCSTQSNIGRYTFIVDGLQTYRCLNTNTECAQHCSTYQFTNQVYKCTQCNQNYLPKSVTINSAIQIRCLNSLTQVVSNCNMYVQDLANVYVCNSCANDFQLEKVTINSQSHLLCLNILTQTVPDCVGYIFNSESSLYLCNECKSGFTLKNVSSTPHCLPNNVIDPQCTEYIYSNNAYKCNQCNSLYTLTSVYKADGTFLNCLLTSSEIIKDCSLYEIVAGGKYECKQCSSSQIGIQRYSFILNGVQLYRCLNSISEHVISCTTYKFENQLYECTQCASGSLKSNVKANNVQTIICLSINTQVVQDCQHYIFEQTTGKYQCDQCNNLFTLKPDNVCVHNSDVQNECVEYKDNGLSEECVSCANWFTLSTVYVNNVPIVQCLSNSQQIITGCKKYQQVYQGYDCIECDSGYSKETILFNSESSFKCLLSSSQIVENCLDYSLNTDGYFVCHSCQNNYNLLNGSETQKVCIKELNIQSNCIQYKDNGAIEQCTRCETLFTLSKVTVNGNSVSKCLSNSLYVLTGCKTYTQVSNSYECTECNSEYSKETVIINSNQKARCLLKSQQIVQDCISYVIGASNKYFCHQCSLEYTVSTGIGNKICVNDNNIQTNCIQYKDEGEIEKCTKCSLEFTLSSVIQGTLIIKKCLSNIVEVIKQCKTYEIPQDQGLQCSECNAGSTKSSVLISSQNHARCLLNTLEVIEDCQTYEINSIGKYICTQCNNGFNLKASVKNQVCVSSDDLQENCIAYVDKGSIEECIQCSQQFSLLKVFSSGTLKKQCLSTKTHLLIGCLTYQILTNGDIQCKQCEQSRSLQLVHLSDTKQINKCIYKEDVSSQCLSYLPIGLSCAHDCNKCSAGFKLTDVKINHRITKRCLNENSQYLPFCRLHFEDNGIYFCRHGLCDIEAFAIPIGPSENSLACAKDDLIQYVDAQKCEYFERPHLRDATVNCQKCKNGYTEPYCLATPYQGLTNGQ